MFDTVDLVVLEAFDQSVDLSPSCQRLFRLRFLGTSCNFEHLLAKMHFFVLQASDDGPHVRVTLVHSFLKRLFHPDPIKKACFSSEELRERKKRDQLDTWACQRPFLCLTLH